MSPPSALESADVLPTAPRTATPSRCVLLVPGAIGPAAGDTPSAAHPPAVNPGEMEDESADPVGDGHSDAELARRLDDAPTPAPQAQPEPQPPPKPDTGTGHAN